ncbi:DNA ligase D [Hyalangium minutum]|uniref:DNA ligase (ATP) n=1 Tax=Hyalangium minutum TaxID=394096 RepID=A0A085WUQ5_9BACT|nr:DNA ligase D [Hyalangium minutum]KFE71418.1 ATP-dependent DNA ligase [Hyalangium minutum]
MKARRSLQTYRAKRDFQKTPEPSPDVSLKKRGAEALFVVHKHDATRMHYDLRLEIDGALASWAIPKGPSYDPKQKRLAVETEDHPMSYARFEGRIPDEEYGGGDSLLWDEGTYETVPPGKAYEQREKGHLVVDLHGDKLQGRWHLIRTRGNGRKNQWLCFKSIDGQEKPDYDVVAERPESVKSGRRETRGPVRKSALERVHPPAETILQRVWPPMLAKLSTPEEASDATHVFEIKYDGFRAIASLSGSGLVFKSRNGNDLSGRFPTVAEALRRLRVPEAVIDGEVVALDKKGRSSFQLLQNQSGGELRFVAFDLLWLDGHDLRDKPLEARRELLESLFSGVKPPLQLAERMNMPMERALKEAQRHGWEGLIAKRKGSAYVGSRSGQWLKLKVIAGQEVVILGFLPIKNEHSAKEIGALLVGVNGPDGYRDVGKVGTGFDTKMRHQLRELLEKIRVDKPVAVDAKKRPGAVWVRPKYVAQVHFTEWTDDGRLRHPVFQGLRTDKKPEEVIRERPSPTARSKARTAEPEPVETAPVPRTRAATKRTATKRTATKRAATRNTGTRRAPGALAARTAKLPRQEGAPAKTSLARLTSGDRVLYPKGGYTKEDVFEFYRQVAPLMLPVLADRPISVQQWPAGILAPGFFKHELSGKPDWVPTLRVKHLNRTIDHVNAKTPDALLWLANQSALTMHMWSSHAPTLTSPDWVLFDLDPGKGTWEDLIRVATAMRKKLESLGLESFPKTSGKRGLHVLVPLRAGYTHEQAMRFANDIANQLALELKDIATTERAINKRGGRLYLDAGQNGRGKTVVAPYSLRAVEAASFSAPLQWSEVTRRLDPSRFNIQTVRKRLDAVGDLFAPVLTTKQKLP